MRCQLCNTEILPGDAYCPACGSPVATTQQQHNQLYNQYYQPPVQKPKSNAGKIMAIISMVLGINAIMLVFLALFVLLVSGVSLADSYYSYYAASGSLTAGLVWLFFALAMAIPGLILASKAKTKLSMHYGTSGRGMATAGQILSIITIIMFGVVFLLVLFVAGVGISNSSRPSYYYYY